MSYKSWDELQTAVIKEYELREDKENLRAIGKDLGISFSEVWEALGFKDWYDFYEE